MTSRTVPESSDEAVRRGMGTLERPKSNGPALAALLAAGLGSAALGIFTTLAEAFASFRSALVIDRAVGPLSGKSTYAVLVYLASWLVLAYVMRGKQYRERPFFIATFVLIGIGLLGTFPIFFELFAP